MNDDQPQASTQIQPASENPLQNQVIDDAVNLATGFTLSQRHAFEALTAGSTIAAAARAANVARQTLYSWLEEGHHFAAAYEQWKNSVAETSRTRLLMIGEAATVQIARSIRQGDTRAALAVAKGMGLLSPPPVGPSLTQSVAKKKAAEAEKAHQQIANDLPSHMTFKDLVDVETFHQEMQQADDREAALELSDDHPNTAE